MNVVFEVIQAIYHQRFVRVVLLDQVRQRGQYVIEGFDKRESIEGQSPLALLGLDKHRRGGLRGKSGFADAAGAIAEDDRC